MLCALSRVRTRDALGACPHGWSCEMWSGEFVACAPCFSGSRAGRVTWVTCVIFVFQLRTCDSLSLCNVADCVHNSCNLEQIADALTKALTCPKHKWHTAKIGLSSV